MSEPNRYSDAIERRVAVRVWGPPVKMVSVFVSAAKNDDEFTPQECRELARLLNEAAGMAERVT